VYDAMEKKDLWTAMCIYCTFHILVFVAWMTVWWWTQLGVDVLFSSRGKGRCGSESREMGKDPTRENQGGISGPRCSSTGTCGLRCDDYIKSY